MRRPHGLRHRDEGRGRGRGDRAADRGRHRRGERYKAAAIGHFFSHGLPIGVATDGASVPETALAGVALGDIPPSVPVPAGVPVVADRGYDSDPLREQLADDGFTLVAPHRRHRKRKRTADGRRLRRYKRRYIVERSFAGLHSYRRVVTRYERRVDLYDGFVHLACAFICLNRLVK